MWNLDSNTAIYSQIVDIISDKIISGDYPIASRLPSVRNLAKEAGVNPNTMQKALTKLEEKGIVNTIRTSGRFVTEDKALINKIKLDSANKISTDYLDKMTALAFSLDETEEIITKAIDKSRKEKL